MAAIEVIVPTDPQFMRLVRLLASGVGSLAGFDIEDIEDFRIGVDEACTMVMAASDGAGLRLTFELRDDEVEVTGTTVGPGPSEAPDVVGPVQRTLSDRILGVVVDRHEVKVSDGQGWFELHKSRVQ